MRCRLALVFVLAASITGNSPGQVPDDGGEQPRGIGLIERSGAKIAQIDVTVLGDPEIVRTLTADDFTLRINFAKIPNFRLDRVCPDAIPEPTLSSRAPELSNVVVPASYILFFDQPHLTLAGRAQSLDAARQLIAPLVDDGNRVMIVSNSDRLDVVEPFSSDLTVLDSALDRLEQDRTQWSLWAEQEDERVADVVRRLNEENQVAGATAMARRHHKDEVAISDRSMRRLRLTLGQLVDLDPPKAVLYFGDTLRENAGEHYLSFFGARLRNDPMISTMETSSHMSGLSLDGVINEASAQGIRIYTVQGEGLVEHMYADLPSASGAARGNSSPAPRSARTQDVQHTLRGMAAETGGASFLNGISPAKMAARIQADASCLFLISFDPTGFREDQPLRASVQVKREGVDLRHRGRLVVLSERARRTASLLRAFGSPDSVEDPFEVRTSLVPTGYEEGRFTALLQVSVAGMPMTGATWELGASIVRRDKIHDESSGQLDVNGPSVGVALEKEIRFRPGSYEVVSVAHESRTGMISSKRSEFFWPDPDDSAATVGPLVLLQPDNGIFLRDGSTRTLGSLAILAGSSIDSKRPTAMVGIVCRGKRQDRELRVERRLIGSTEVDFPPLTLDLQRDRCAQVRDLIPALTMGSGRYRYRVAVLEDETEIAGGELAFQVAEP